MGKKLAGRQAWGRGIKFLSEYALSPSHTSNPDGKNFSSDSTVTKNFDAKMSKASCTGALLTYTRIKCP